MSAVWALRRAESQPHHCHAAGCPVQVPPRMFACRRHWRMVPGQLQRALWAVYRPGQESDKVVTTAYLIVQTCCRLAIARAEGRLDAQADLERTLRHLATQVERWSGLGEVELIDAVEAWAQDEAAHEAWTHRKPAMAVCP